MSLILIFVVTTLFPGLGEARGGRDRVARDFRHADQDGDDGLNRAEWNRRGYFYRLDPMAFYRQKPPYDSASVKALADAEKDVAIPILFDDATSLPSDTKIIWPYACGRD